VATDFVISVILLSQPQDVCGTGRWILVDDLATATIEWLT